jgi:hypothetical protein
VELLEPAMMESENKAFKTFDRAMKKGNKGERRFQFENKGERRFSVVE